MDDNNTAVPELVLTPPNEKLARRRSPSLVTVGNRMVSSDGRFHPDLAANYVTERGHAHWVHVTELAKIFSTNTNDGRKRVRRNLSAVFTKVLDAGNFLVYETAGKRGQIQAVKLLDPQSEIERAHALPQLERMRQRRELTVAKYQKALAVIQDRQAIDS
jgi:hypothetical protein